MIYLLLLVYIDLLILENFFSTELVYLNNRSPPILILLDFDDELLFTIGIYGLVCLKIGLQYIRYYHHLGSICCFVLCVT